MINLKCKNKQNDTYCQQCTDYIYCCTNMVHHIGKQVYYLSDSAFILFMSFVTFTTFNSASCVCTNTHTHTLQPTHAGNTLWFFWCKFNEWTEFLVAWRHRWNLISRARKEFLSFNRSYPMCVIARFVERKNRLWLRVLHFHKLFM